MPIRESPAAEGGDGPLLNRWGQALPFHPTGVMKREDRYSYFCWFGHSQMLCPLWGLIAVNFMLCKFRAYEIIKLKPSLRSACGGSRRDSPWGANCRHSVDLLFGWVLSAHSSLRY